MKKDKIIAVLYYFASVCFFIVAIRGYANDNSITTVWLCLGAAMLCLGSASVSKFKKGKDDNEE